jgi:glycosyltransferase involved in cell wall biosynthesis
MDQMSAPSLVSVVIPCFNAAEYLSGAVRSVQAQGVPGTEIIVVDDQSTDDSNAVAEALAGQVPGVRLIQQAVNSGPSTARNAGLRHAWGRYVCFLDADDAYAPGFFSGVISLSAATTVAPGLGLAPRPRSTEPRRVELEHIRPWPPHRT